MHELGVILEVVKTVEDIAIKNHLTKIDTIVLQIGELSSMIPKYIKACYPAAVDGTAMEFTKLKIDVLPANALCKHCNKVYNILKNREGCPYCEGKDWDLLCGKEFLIKEIVAY
ncbi:hydrogenase maturation nickel metallochaperone HypA [Clostridium sp. Marseille-Q2269]|uniref:hydrogenase maturation nickel metallochaperone HypA/HybF n=1 Tax=Clostridium sp. Marseille-Q2269 TaxID=2942205 RepID=UPI0020732DFD|nr:hydrogenase maturation nickel metallochaperone HypA [Clostridium sp. Marseille-Q2269]